MYRTALEYLKAWRTNKNRKPLVIRGARQVGKTYLIRLFAGENFDRFVEINLERDPEVALLFTSNGPHRIVQLLELQFNTPIQPLSP